MYDHLNTQNSGVCTEQDMHATLYQVETDDTEHLDEVGGMGIYMKWDDCEPCGTKPEGVMAVLGTTYPAQVAKAKEMCAGLKAAC